MSTPFYDELAPYYHLIYVDWEGAINRQGSALSSLLSAAGVTQDDLVLDAACGIGTQTLGLLKQGYRVNASDVSAGAIARLKTELVSRGFQSKAYVDDLRTLAHATAESMAAIIACDNSVPHLLSDDEILQAFRSCYRCIRPGGVAVFSVRDYANIERKSPDVRPYELRYEGDMRFLPVQVWEWDGDHYEVRMYLISEASTGVCETKVLRSRCYAVSITRLMELLTEDGFINLLRRDDVFFQPVLLGRRAYAAYRDRPQVAIQRSRKRMF